MKQARILCAMYSYMMREFSRRTVAGLKTYKLFKLLLPPFKSFLEINLEKEIDKNQAVIACAVEALRLGRPPDQADTELLLRRARDIDQVFLHKAHSLSSAIHINYHEIDQVRQRRMELVINAAYQVLAQWRDQARLRQVIGGLYNREQFQSLLSEILKLYILETGVLSKSVKIPRALARFRDAMINAVHEVMRTVADQLAIELTNQIYRHQR